MHRIVALDGAWKPPPGARATIVFVHGAVVQGVEMGLLRHRLKGLGYGVRQFRYPSMLRGLEENVRQLADFIARTEGDVVHVVAHSMGGVLTRHVFERWSDPRPGRLVAIGSPFLDCWIGHRISGLHGHAYRLLGKTVHDHITGPRDPVWRGAREFGVVAGTYPFGLGNLFADLPGPSDGTVLWEETRLQGITDHVSYRINHFGLLGSRRCCAQVACFLATGAFEMSEREAVVARQAQPSRGASSFSTT